MSTVDSTFNSIATLWSIDIYSQFINKRATSLEQINAGKKSIIVSLFSGLTMSFIFLNIKFYLYQSIKSWNYQ
jgi:SSS family solute:Na+ symporter